MSERGIALALALGALSACARAAARIRARPGETDVAIDTREAWEQND